MAKLLRRVALGVVGALVAGAVGVAVFAPELVEVLARGESRRLRPTPAAPASPRKPDLLVLALDGLDRSLLYDMLRAGELPALARLLGGRDADGAFPHAHLDARMLATMPSSTIPGWATVFTGVTPAEHGVSGNEFFIRERRVLAAPAPVSFEDSTPVLAVYTDDYADALLPVPTLYEQLRAREPRIRAWVSMSQFHRGADRLLTARRTVLADAFRAFVEHAVGDDDGADLYGALDREVMETVCEALDEEPPPDVLTIYLAGADLYAHHARRGPDVARRRYLREVLDPQFAQLHATLSRRGAVANRYVVLLSDHGHTQVLADDAHALRPEGPGEPADVLRAAGFRVRPFALDVDDDHDFQSVIAFGGGTAFVYLADRSRCPAAGQRCDFAHPPRYAEDVLAAAEAFYAASRRPGPLRDAIAHVLVRRPRPWSERDAPFEVYVGGGETRRIDVLASEGVAAERRLADLAVGPRGERAGDVLLLARTDASLPIGRRYYFSATYHSWHGGLGAKDSEVPFIIAHPARGSASLRAAVDAVAGDGPLRLQAVTPLLLRLRAGLDAPRTTRASSRNPRENPPNTLSSQNTFMRRHPSLSRCASSSLEFDPRMRSSRVQ